MRLKILLIFCVFFCKIVTSQNKQILVGFDEIPQSLMINPGNDVSFQKHIGFPFLSGISMNAVSSNLTLHDLFADDGVDINDKIRNLLFSLSPKNHVAVNIQLELINIGFRLKNDKDYVSFGLYQELDFINYYPKDAAILFYQGNTDRSGNLELNRPYELSDINFKGDLISVLHAGISRKVNKKLTAGLRIKLYAGAFNFQSVHNKGTFTTVVGENNIVQHQFNNIDFALRSSGVIGNNSNDGIVKTTLKNMILNSNFGLGFDVGFTYNLKNDIALSGSILDIGFINYNNNVKTYSLQGDYNLDGLDLLTPIDIENPDLGPWEQLTDEFDDELNSEETSRTYFTYRPIKLNAGIEYKFGKKLANLKKGNSLNCAAFEGRKLERQNRAGLQLYSIFRAKQPQVALTGFYYRKVFRSLAAKVTYTADSYSIKNIGVGISTNLGNVHFYSGVDNILGYTDLSKSNSLSVQFGFNWILQ